MPVLRFCRCRATFPTRALMARLNHKTLTWKTYGNVFSWKWLVGSYIECSFCDKVGLEIDISCVFCRVFPPEIGQHKRLVQGMEQQ